MTAGTEALKNAWRDSVTTGVPATGKYEPDKAEIRAGLTMLSLDIAAAAASTAGDGIEAIVAAIQPLVDEAQAAAEDSATTLNGVPAARLVQDNSNGDHRIFTNIEFTVNRTYDIDILLRSNEVPFFALFNAAGGLSFNAIVNVSGRTVSGGATAVYRGDNTFLLKFTAIAVGSDAANIQLRMMNSTGETSFVGDGTSSLDVAYFNIYEDGVLRWGGDAATVNGFTRNGLGGTAIAPEKVGGLVSQVESLLEQPSGDASSPLMGVSWACAGTSQTAFDYYPATIDSITGMARVNVGVSGTTFSNGGTNASAGIFNQIGSIPTTVRIVAFEGLINDHYFDVPLGTINDTGLGTFYGALYANWRAGAARAPNAAIVFLVGTSGAGTGENAVGRSAGDPNALGLTPGDYQNAMVAFCKKYNILFVNLAQLTGINAVNAARFLLDGLHYGPAGGTVVGKFAGRDLIEKTRRGMLD